MLEEHYGYALNQDNELVHISQALQQKHLGHSYRCLNPECNTEMLTVHGKVRISHFRHKNAVCSPETYQHQLAKRLIQQRILGKKQAILAFECSFCGDPKGKQVDLSKILSHAVLEHKYPESNFIGDVAAFDHNNELKIMFEVYVTHKVDGEKLNQPKWVEVVADQIIREDYLSDQAVVWRVARSCTDKAIYCHSCNEVIRQLHDQEQEIRMATLLKYRNRVAEYGDHYYAGLADFNITGLSDLNYICDQIELNIQAPNYEGQKAKEERIAKRNAYIGLLYRLHWVQGFWILIEDDNPISKRAKVVALEHIKFQYWKVAQKQKRMPVSEHPSAS